MLNVFQKLFLFITGKFAVIFLNEALTYKHLSHVIVHVTMTNKSIYLKKSPLFCQDFLYFRQISLIG